MKALKKADYIIQIGLVIVAVMSILALGIDLFDGPVIPMYFIVGGWQMISVITHLFIKKEYKIRLRQLYIVLLIVTMAAGFICAFSDAIIGYLVVLLIWSPVLAILYIICCYREVQKMTQPAGVNELTEQL